MPKTIKYGKTGNPVVKSGNPDEFCPNDVAQEDSTTASTTHQCQQCHKTVVNKGILL